MIISWFTQPPGKFASYYQYDTATLEFSRTRLELGRSSSTRTNDTFVSYNPERTVGFASAQYPTSNPDEHWSVNGDGKLCYDGTALPSAKPSAGDRVYDTSDPASFVHRGNPVTETPVLPEGIEPKHLALLANDAMLNQRTIQLTAGNAKASELVGAIKGEVCRVLEVTDFASITDSMLLAKLTSQIKSQSALVAEDSVRSLNGALAEAKKASALIDEQIIEGIITPDEAFTKACVSLQEAINKAQTAKTDANVKQALTEIGKAQDAVNKAIKTIDTVKFENVSKQLDIAKESLRQAQSHAEEWQEVEVDYEKLAEASSIEDYGRELGLPETEEVVV